jgi:hypothetical protein
MGSGNPHCTGRNRMLGIVVAENAETLAQVTIDHKKSDVLNLSIK